MIRIFMLIAVLTAGLVSGGCPKIQEPWVEGNRLAAERSRPPEQVQELAHRFIRVQSDR